MDWIEHIYNWGCFENKKVHTVYIFYIYISRYIYTVHLQTRFTGYIYKVYLKGIVDLQGILRRLILMQPSKDPILKLNANLL